MLIESLEHYYFDLGAYEKYLKIWLNGITSEISHWRRVMETKGPWPDWNDYISDDRKCTLEEYFETSEVECIDIGSGPFSSSGAKSDKVKLRFTAVDPLAHSYNFLKRKHGITAGVIPEYCMVEKLTEKFEDNTFDIVHMRNALDHAFNPVFGIIQMIAICKINGKVVLQHTKNEALRENYHGFHQWNLCVENGEFFVWRLDDRYNISKMLGEYVDIIIEDKPENWVGIVMRKKKNIKADVKLQKSLAKILDEKIFEKLSEYAALEAYSIKNNVISAINKVPILKIIGYKTYKKLYNKRT